MLDKLWWFCNRKPSRRFVPYLGLVLCNVVFGALALLGLAVMSVQFWFGIIIIAYTFVWLVVFYWYDNKHGFVDAYYRAYLAQRERIGKKLGKM